jgi:hypothetical protein
LRRDSRQAESLIVTLACEPHQKGETDMAKGNNQRGNREKRKPKAIKTKPSASSASPFAPAPGMSKGNVGGKKR